MNVLSKKNRTILLKRISRHSKTKENEDPFIGKNEIRTIDQLEKQTN